MDHRYTIAAARLRDAPALAAIERAAATFLQEHVPPSVLNETTGEDDLGEAQANGRLWVALANDTPVGFALVEMLATDLPNLRKSTSILSTGSAGLGPRACERSASGLLGPDIPR